MPWWIVEWTEQSLEKCRQRGIDPDAVEALVRRPHRPLRSRSSGRPLTFGWVEGEFIAAVYEKIDRTTVRIITVFRP